MKRGTRMNLDHLITFLQMLEPDNYETHQFLWSGTHPSGIQRLQAYGTLEAMLPRLIERNEQGYGIFIAINAIDTPVYEGDYPRRRNKDITRVRSCFADWDNPNKPIPDPPLPPTMIVSTSPGKYHIHWCVDDCPLFEFEPIQKGIARMFETDPTVHDLARELRVPGFLHTKDMNNRHPVLLLESGGKRYSFTQLKEAFSPDKKKLKVPTWNGKDIERKTALTAAAVAAMHLPIRTDGGYNIRCPWASEHTTPDSASCATYWPPSKNNDGRGAYKCMHAHCANRMVSELDNWVASEVAKFMG
jgi:hypothetical protein